MTLLWSYRALIKRLSLSMQRCLRLQVLNNEVFDSMISVLQSLPELDLLPLFLMNIRQINHELCFSTCVVFFFN